MQTYSLSPFSRHETGDSHWNHQTQPTSTRFLAVAVVLTLTFSAIELLGGLWSNSLALIGDAGHMVTDSASLFFALVASRLAARGADHDHSFGHGRMEVLAAFINGLIMLGVVAWLVYEAVGRFTHPAEVNGSAVMGIAAVGLVINIVVAYVLSRDQQNVNTRAALMHVLGDMLGSIAALIAGAVIMCGGPVWMDAFLSLFVSVLLLRASLSILKEASLVLLDGVPDNLDYDKVGKLLEAIPGVTCVHDLHVWTMAPGHAALQCHVEVKNPECWPQTLDLIRLTLEEKCHITHVTVQPEWPNQCEDSSCEFCHDELKRWVPDHVESPLIENAHEHHHHH